MLAVLSLLLMCGGVSSQYSTCTDPKQGFQVQYQNHGHVGCTVSLSASVRSTAPVQTPHRNSRYNRIPDIMAMLAAWLAVLSSYTCAWVSVRSTAPVQRKRKGSDSVLWQKPLHPLKNPKSNVTTQKMYQNFDYTTITDRLRTVSWGNDSDPTGVVKTVYGIPTFPLTAKAV